MEPRQTPRPTLGKRRWLALVVGLLVMVPAIWFAVRPSDSRVETSGLEPAPALPQGEPLFRVRVNGKYGFIDRSGTIVIEPKLAHAFPFEEGLAPAMDSTGGRWGYIDRQAQWIIEPRFQIAACFSEGLAAVREEVSSPWGFIDRTGAWIFPPQFEAANPFRNGRALVGRQTLIGKAKSSIDAGDASDWRWRAIDRTGRDLGAVQRDYEPDFGADGLRQVWSGRLLGFEDRAGVVVIPHQFEATTGFSEGLAAVHLPGQPWGYIDRSGAWVVPPRHGWSNPFRDGLAEVVADEGKAGYIDRQGNWVWPPSK